MLFKPKNDQAIPLKGFALWVCMFFCLGMFTCFAVKADEPKPNTALVIGMVPVSNAQVLFESYNPLRLFLQTHLQREVRFVTAPDFAEFMRRALAGRYDIAICAGHQARLLQVDAGFLPLVTYQSSFQVYWVKAANNPAIARLEDLNGKKILDLGETSLAGIWSKQQLAQRGVVPAHVGSISSTDSIAEWIVSGKVDAGVLSTIGVAQLNENLQEKIQIFECSPVFMTRTYMLNPRLSGELEAIRAVLDAFALTDEGKAHFQHSKLLGFRDIDPAELAAMEPYARALRVQLSNQGKTN